MSPAAPATGPWACVHRVFVRAESTNDYNAEGQKHCKAKECGGIGSKGLVTAAGDKGPYASAPGPSDPECTQHAAVDRRSVVATHQEGHEIAFRSQSEANQG